MRLFGVAWLLDYRWRFFFWSWERFGARLLGLACYVFGICFNAERGSALFPPAWEKKG